MPKSTARMQKDTEAYPLIAHISQKRSHSCNAGFIIPCLAETIGPRDFAGSALKAYGSGRGGYTVA
jgi:hypothetical protein